MQILNTSKMIQKIKRISIEILERNLGEEEIYFLGINNSGYALANILAKDLSELNINTLKTHVVRIKVNASHPTSDEILLENVELSHLENKNIILVDDVANTGRTLFYAFAPLMKIIPKKLEVAVMVDREHKLFPVKVDYVGLSLATTLMENIQVDLSDVSTMNAILV